MSISQGSNELLLVVAPIEYHWPQLLLNNFSLSSNEMSSSPAQKDHDRLRLKQDTIFRGSYKILFAIPCTNYSQIHWNCRVQFDRINMILIHSIVCSIIILLVRSMVQKHFQYNVINTINITIDKNLCCMKYVYWFSQYKLFRALQ